MDSPEIQHIDCVMPAAGLSSRMGDWKLMLPYRDGVLLDASIDNALGFCTRLILVGGHRFDELAARYQGRANITVLRNADYQQGMFCSIQVGVTAVQNEHFFISHGDMPCIDPAIYQAMWQQRGAGTLFPGNPQQPGHPVLLPDSLVPAILAAPPQSQMKKIITTGPVRYLGLTEEAIWRDIDTPEAYQSLLTDSLINRR